MSGGGPGPSCTNPYPNSTESAQVDSLWANGIALPAKIHVPSIFLSLGVAVTVGVLFGWYPAWRASRLEPVEALRHN